MNLDRVNLVREILSAVAEKSGISFDIDSAAKYAADGRRSKRKSIDVFREAIILYASDRGDRLKLQ